ncbi:hypothetical protein F971_01812 [Acinetobacter vivianii]|uniref:Transmembrane protein n=1 Tax=Acinetobacter vivianii TaxID=1776742 RepID=N8UZL8_9GAMM|nr:hypothetical protein F971_01812 [Acinetobacter vivianii]
MQYDDEYNKTRPKRYNYILQYLWKITLIIQIIKLSQLLVFQYFKQVICI